MVNEKNVFIKHVLATIRNQIRFYCAGKDIKDVVILVSFSDVVFTAITMYYDDIVKKAQKEGLEIKKDVIKNRLSVTKI